MITSKKFKVIVVDSSPVYRFGLTTLLGGISFIESVDEAEDAYQAIKIIESKKCDVVLIDIKFIKLAELEKVQRDSRLENELIIIALLINENQICLDKLFQSKVQAFLLKSCDLDEVVKSLTEVLAGNRYYSKQVLNLISLHENKIHVKKSSYLDININSILFLMYHEKTSKEIAGILNLSCRTVENYRTKILRDTNSENMIGVMKYVIENGIHSDELLIYRLGKFCIKKDHHQIDYNR